MCLQKKFIYKFLNCTQVILSNTLKKKFEGQHIKILNQVRTYLNKKNIVNVIFFMHTNFDVSKIFFIGNIENQIKINVL